MDASTGQCESVKYTYSGSLAPLNEELSIHMRGPTWLKEIAVYTPGTAIGKRSVDTEKQEDHGYVDGYHHGSVHHAHEQLHKAKAKRAVGDLVTATMDGQVVHWTNEYAGPGGASNQGDSVKPAVGNSNSSPSTSEIADPSPQSLFSSKILSGISPSSSLSFSANVSSTSTITRITALSLFTHTSTRSQSTTLTMSKQLSASSEGWVRDAYYNAGEWISQGLTFLNHFGQADSIPAFGASLSYSSQDAISGAKSAQILGNAMLENDTELVILSNRSCDDSQCGYTRSGGLAYHGFGGDHKIFLISFIMPVTGKTGFNADMPVIWLMNAQIPLTSQYGTNPQCSCWTSGCGEFDIFEILDASNTRCKSTLHIAPAGGSSDYFQRPTDQTVKAAIVFTGSDETATIQILNDIVSFQQDLTEEYIQQFITGPTGKTRSLFHLG